MNKINTIIEHFSGRISIIFSIIQFSEKKTERNVRLQISAPILSSDRALPTEDDDFMALLQQNIIWNARKLMRRFNFTKIADLEEVFLALGLHQELDQVELSGFSLNQINLLQSN